MGNPGFFSTCCKEFCKNIWASIGYTILIVVLAVVGGLFFADALTGMKPYDYKEDDEHLHFNTPALMSVVDKYDLKGHIFKFNYGKGKTTVFNIPS